MNACFEADGYAGPFVLGTPAQMNFVALQLTRTVFGVSGPDPADPYVNRHLDSPLVAQLCTHPAILGQVAPILGADLVVWRSLFFSKGAAARDVLWHQDSHFWRLDPPLTLTAWVAIDRAHDCCLEVIPGSHRSDLEHVPAPSGSQFPRLARVSASELARARELPVDEGMFVLFDQRLAHRSKSGGRSRRLALSIRIAPAHVRIDPALLPADGRVLAIRRGS
ncbi:MAG TPA: phytanoyl-CoA dioxygenase family protein [Burkholderiales bacterium]|nr:phytanoyl-CoA dioxygenase family protein [Burkholderiales bacterium]